LRQHDVDAVVDDRVRRARRLQRLDARAPLGRAAGADATERDGEVEQDRAVGHEVLREIGRPASDFDRRPRLQECGEPLRRRKAARERVVTTPVGRDHAVESDRLLQEVDAGVTQLAQEVDREHTRVELVGASARTGADVDEAHRRASEQSPDIPRRGDRRRYGSDHEGRQFRSRREQSTRDERTGTENRRSGVPGAELAETFGRDQLVAPARGNRRREAGFQAGVRQLHRRGRPSR
jgi:hypothetical protein